MTVSARVLEKLIFENAEVLGDGEYAVEDVPGAEGFAIGRGPHGSVVLLTPPEPDEAKATERRLKHVRLSSRAEIEGGAFAGLLELRDAPTDLVPVFCRIAVVAMELVGVEPADGEVEEAFRRLADLFATGRAKRKSPEQVVAELVLLAAAQDRSLAAEAWTDRADARFTFSLEGQHVLVRATKSSRHVDLDSATLAVRAQEECFVVTAVCARSSLGPSLPDLVGDITASLGEDALLVARVLDVVATALGDAWREEYRSSRWDDTAVLLSSVAVAAADVPGPRPPFDDGVRGVTLHLDLTDVGPLVPVDQLPIIGRAGVRTSDVGHRDYNDPEGDR